MNILTKLDLQKYIKNENTTFSLDRFEGEFAVCENRISGEMINISKNLLPISAKVGDILMLKNLEFVVDIQNTEKEQEEIKNLVNTLFKRKS